jgi:PAS domain S-box-containing protein
MDRDPSTILIVEDEHTMREGLEDLLASEGYHVASADNGAQALARAAELTPDLILLDVLMPDIDGLEVCRRLRADPLLTEVPVVMVTSLGDRDSRLRGFEAGADDFVSKPIDEAELLARVRAITRLNRYRRLLLEQTHRRHAEEALEISQARYYDLFERVPVGLYRSTPDGQNLDANHALVEMLGYPDRETLLATNAVDGYVNPEDRQRWQALMEREGTVRGFETQWRRHDGTTIWVRESARAVRDDEDQTLYYEGAIEDITERVRTEAVRRRAEQLLRALNQAAVAMEKALTPEEVFAAVAEELEKLGFSCILLPLDESRTRLFTRYLSYEPRAVKAVEKLVCLRQEDFSFPIENAGMYRDVVLHKETIFVENAEDVLRHVLPGPVRKSAGQVAKMLRIPKAIAAPLIIGDEVIGLLSVQSDDLTEEDIPAVTAFANQVVAAWHKGRLYEQAQQEIAERKRAEEAVRMERDRAQQYLDVAEVMLVALNGKGEIDLINRKGCRILGCDKEGELLGKDWFDTCLPGNIRESVRAVFDRLMAGEIEPVEYYENPVVTKTGEERLIAWHNTVLKDEAGNSVGTLSSGEDITERVRTEAVRRQAEEALRQSEVRFRSLVEHTTDAVFCYEYDPPIPTDLSIDKQVKLFYEGVLAECNDAAAKSYGATRADQVVGKKLTELFGTAPGSLDDFFKAFIQNEYQIVDAEDVEILEDGSKRSFLNNGYGVLEGGQLLRVWGTFRDITERRQAEEALRESEENYRSVVDNANVGLVVVQEGKRVFHNSRAREILGYSEQEYQQVDFVTAIHPDDREFALDRIRQRARGGEIGPEGLEIRLLTKSGETRWVQANSSLIHWEGKPALQAFIIDITERKQAEELLRIQRDLGIALGSVSGLTAALDLLLEAACQMERIDSGGVYLVDTPTGELNLAAHTGLSAEFVESVFHYDADAPNTQLILAGKPVYQHSSDFPPIMRQPLQHEGLRVLAVIPVAHEEQIVAAINLASHTHDRIPLSTHHALETIAAQIGDVIARVRAEEALHQSEETARALLNATTDVAILIEPDGTVLAGNEMAARIFGTSADKLAGLGIGDLLPPDLLEVGTARSDEVVRSGEPIRFQAEWQEAIVDIGIYPVFGARGELTRLAAFARDITEQIRAEERIKQRARELEALNEIGQAIASTLDLQETLTLIAEHTTKLMGMAATSVLLCDETGEDLYFAAASGEGADFVVSRRLAMGQGIAGWVAQHGESVLVPDVSQDPRWHGTFDEESGFTTRSILCVPLRSKRRTVGVIEAINKEGGFSQDDLRLLTALAAPVAAAIENARLFEEVRTGHEQLQALSRRLVEVQEVERAYVARELHDETGQALSSLLLGMSLLEQETDCPEEVKDRVVQMEATIDKMLENLHRLAMHLRPATLDHLGLVAALEQYVETLEQQHGITARFETVGLGDERLPPEVETALYRIVQEALTNVLRHAQATRVDVLLERRGDQVVTIVEDDGIGFDPEAAKESERLGLFGMRERAHMLGGKLVIESAAGTGTAVFVEVPYARSNQEA